MAAVEKFKSPFGSVELTDERERRIFKFHPEVKKYRENFAEAIAEPEDIRISNKFKTP